MTKGEQIEHFEARARQEREAAKAADNSEARKAHSRLAMEYDRAAERERADTSIGRRA